tara:strand:+ start:1524 stop:2069 length:546 start_codon:yes stop_codon:yes gene_type:complete
MVIPTERTGKELKFDRSIPGESLTSNPGDAEWEKPPKINTAEEAIDYIMYSINSDEGVLQEIVGLMDAGIAIEALTEGLAFGGFVNGAWSPDVAELMKPGLAKELWELSRDAGITARLAKDIEKGPSGHLDVRRALRPETLKGAEDVPMEEAMLAGLGEEEEFVEEGGEETGGFINMMGSA